MSLGTASGLAANVKIGLCAQSNEDGIIFNLAGSFAPVVDVNTARVSHGVSASTFLNAGTYNFGACAWNQSATLISNNGNAYGYVQIHN
jgi:hypothetical protein